MAGEVGGWAPAVDMLDRKDEVILRADLPGLEQKDIEVNVGEGLLTIRGQRKGREGGEGGGLLPRRAVDRGLHKAAKGKKVEVKAE